MTAFFAAGVYNQVCLQNSRVLGILIAINVSEIHIQRLLIKTSHHDQVSGLGEDLQRGKQNIAVLEVATACFIRKAPSSKGSASYRCKQLQLVSWPGLLRARRDGGLASAASCLLSFGTHQESF